MCLFVWFLNDYVRSVFNVFVCFVCVGVLVVSVCVVVQMRVLCVVV